MPKPTSSGNGAKLKAEIVSLRLVTFGEPEEMPAVLAFPRPQHYREAPHSVVNCGRLEGHG
jgi:hypothetical protein